MKQCDSVIIITYLLCYANLIGLFVCRWQTNGMTSLLVVKMFLFTLSWGQVCIVPLFESNYGWKLFKFFIRERWKG